MSENNDRDMTLTIMVEIPKGCRNKYEYDKELGMLRFDRMLFSSVHYPSDYGFIMDTLALDGDALDALVLVWEPTFPGVPLKDPFWSHIANLSDVPQHLLKEIEHFFTTYKDLEYKETGIEGWAGYDAAIKVIKESQKRYQNSLTTKKK